jgi:prophage regulatory protein
MAICSKKVDVRRFREVIQPEPPTMTVAPSERGVVAGVGGSIRLLRLAQVIAMTGLGKTKIYELQAEGDFPRRVRITANSVGWIESEVQEWLATRIAISRSRLGSAMQQPTR